MNQHQLQSIYLLLQLQIRVLCIKAPFKKNKRTNSQIRKFAFYLRTIYMYKAFTAQHTQHTHTLLHNKQLIKYNERIFGYMATTSLRLVLQRFATNEYKIASHTCEDGEAVNGPKR